MYQHSGCTYSVRQSKWRVSDGFTLIELLIVVSIIAILAAIAIPNFLESQTRAKVARSKSDMRSIGVAIECYCVDNNRYPTRPVSPQDNWQPLLTTPIAYIGGTIQDVFCKKTDTLNIHYQYSMCVPMKSWIMVSVGPDTLDSFNETMWMCGMWNTYPPVYDATNGTISTGDIVRVCKQGGTPPPGTAS